MNCIMCGHDERSHEYHGCTECNCRSMRLRHRHKAAYYYLDDEFRIYLKQLLDEAPDGTWANLELTYPTPPEVKVESGFSK